MDDRLVIIFFVVLAVLLFAVLLLQRWRIYRLERLAARQARDRKALGNFLNRFTHSIAAVEDMDNTVIALGRFISDAIHARSLCIFFTDEQRKNLHAVATIGQFPSLSSLDGLAAGAVDNLRDRRVEIGKGFLGAVARNMRPVLFSRHVVLPDDIPLPRTQGIRCAMAVPIVLEGELKGLICAVDCSDRDGIFDEDDLALLESISGHAALARSIIDTYQRIGEQKRMEQELDFARAIQKTLMPEFMPVFKDLVVAGTNLPAKEVSGDYYDSIVIDENRTLLVVADASGKGVPACLIMTMTRSVLRSLCSRFTSLDELLLELNAYMVRDTEMSRFVTMVICLVDTENRSLEMARAGHTPIMLRNRSNEVFEISPDGPAIGLLPNELGISFETFSLSFSDGYSLMFFSDGLTEAVNENGEEFGMARLVEAWRRCAGGPDSTIQALLAEVAAFAGDTEQADDQTLMVMTMKGS